MKLRWEECADREASQRSPWTQIYGAYSMEVKTEVNHKVEKSICMRYALKVLDDKGPKGTKNYRSVKTANQR